MDQAILRLVLAGAYATGALLTLLAGRRGMGRDRRFWFFAAMLLFGLALAKALHLVDELIGGARTVAKAGGWYAVHGEVQAAFVLALIVAGTGAAIFLVRSLRRSATTVQTAAAALLFLTAFLVLRAASIHVIDIWMMPTIAGMRQGWWLELAAVAVICAAAVQDRRARNTHTVPG